MHEHLKATAKNGIQSRQRVTELDWQITMNLIIKVSNKFSKLWQESMHCEIPKRFFTVRRRLLESKAFERAHFNQHNWQIIEKEIQKNLMLIFSAKLHRFNDVQKLFHII